MGGNKTGGAGDKLGGPALPQPGPKTATDCIVLNHAWLRCENIYTMPEMYNIKW